MIHQHEPATDIKTLKYLEKKQLARRIPSLHHEKTNQKNPTQTTTEKKTFRITYTNSKSGSGSD